MVTLQGLTVAFLVARQGVEQVELTGPWQAVREAGGTPRLISTGPGRIQAFRHLDRADTFAVDETVEEADVERYAGLVLPGGVANPDFLRLDRAAVDLVREFVHRGKPIAAICHAPWLLVEADVVRGRTLTSWPSLRTDLVNAGADWVDEELRSCAEGPNTLITSRKPADLPLFEDALVTEFAKGRRSG
ncbi:type 1 glutamine amidotransferase domain-containing protein [Kitasatospora sp. NPDC056138]|uniref:type 1 glutamine amidotransferase domain-containing protein n=1 Tax=Kitasatospora sp. NPDC056138 TaxID=3345724 RepID=UPI0035D8BE4B